MSEAGPGGIYVFQPFGIQNKHHWKAGRIFGIAGMPSFLTTITGLTREEADAIAVALKCLAAGVCECGLPEGAVPPPMPKWQPSSRDIAELREVCAEVSRR